jgi:tetratricopeptide (TPR) repeat protein
MQTGESETVEKPTFAQNLQFFFQYQVGWMYMRYFCWNFVGRQNDIQGHGNKSDGNWITGIKAYDEYRLGRQTGMPDGSDANKAKNHLFGLPLILGLLGLWFHFKKDKKNATVVALLFIFTGIAIVAYLNQKPFEPRERDYAYAGSFYAFAFWIGLGVLALYEFLEKKINQTTGAALATGVCLLAVPTIMAKEEWNDHNRHNRFIARDFASDYLNSCAPNAILFTNGDNDTFPLWYAQEVEGIRTDVRVICLELLNTDWYIDQMVHKAYDSDPVPFSLKKEQYQEGTRNAILFRELKNVQGNISVKELVEFAKSDDRSNQLEMGGGTFYNYFPTRNMRIPVDSATVVNNGTVPKELANRIEKNIDWTMTGNYVQKNYFMVLDLLAHNDWKRPIYFAATAPARSYLNLAPYMQLEGLAYRLVPIKQDNKESQMDSRIDTEIMYNNLMNKFKWGGMEVKGTYLDDVFVRSCALNIRQRAGALAMALVDENKKDKAIKVLDKIVEVTPQENVPYDATMYSIVIGYYQSGAYEKANDIARKLFTNYETNLRYYYSLNRKDIPSFGSDVEQAQDILERLVYFAGNFKQKELSEEFEKRYSNLLQEIGLQSKASQRAQ